MRSIRGDSVDWLVRLANLQIVAPRVIDDGKLVVREQSFQEGSRWTLFFLSGGGWAVSLASALR